jgi:CIC family chloride channel protein
LALALVSLAVGAATGLIGAAFRLSLDYADQVRNWLIVRAHDLPVLGFFLVVAICAAATAAAAWMVRRFSPHASGSGIPHVEAVLADELPPAPPSMIPVKFAGGVLAIGAGLALGREGPSVQMGAGVAHLVGKAFRRNWPDLRVLIAAGAGLATAFNSPIAGAIFVLEELVRRFETRIAIAALGASTTAIAVSRLFLGEAPDFHVEPLTYVDAITGPLWLALGAIAGLLGVAYNRVLLGAIAALNRPGRSTVEVRAALIGGAVGILAWFEPHLVGGGDAITQATLSGATAISILPLAFLLRFGLGAISYAAKTPGGLFAPMLVLGTQLGLYFGACCHWAFPGLGIQPEAFAVIGMAAFFTGVVRAPMTGIVLVIEMTASFTLLLPMLGACFAAMVVPTLLRNEPIYESLREGKPPT